MDSKKVQIIEFAKNLYLEVDAEGKKIHTFENVSKLIQKKFKISTTYSTIAKWAKKYDWEGLFEKIKMTGVEKGKQQLQEKENLIIDEKSQVIADIYKSNKQLHTLSQKTILSRLTGNPLTDSTGKVIDSDIGNSDLIRLLQHSENGLLELLDKRKSNIDNEIVITRKIITSKD